MHKINPSKYAILKIFILLFCAYLSPIQLTSAAWVTHQDFSPSNRVTWTISEDEEGTFFENQNGDEPIVGIWTYVTGIASQKTGVSVFLRKSQMNAALRFLTNREFLDHLESKSLENIWHGDIQHKAFSDGLFMINFLQGKTASVKKRRSFLNILFLGFETIQPSLNTFEKQGLQKDVRDEYVNIMKYSTWRD